MNQYLGKEGNASLETHLQCAERERKGNTVQCLQYAKNLSSRDDSERMDRARKKCPWLHLSLPDKGQQIRINIGDIYGTRKFKVVRRRIKVIKYVVVEDFCQTRWLIDVDNLICHFTRGAS